MNQRNCFMLSEAVPSKQLEAVLETENIEDKRDWLVLFTVETEPLTTLGLLLHWKNRRILVRSPAFFLWKWAQHVLKLLALCWEVAVI